MIRPPPRSTLSSSSAASDVYKRQAVACGSPCTDYNDDWQAWLLFCHNSCQSSSRTCFGRSAVSLATRVAVRGREPECRSAAVLAEFAVVRATDRAKRRHQGLVACRAALPFEGL